MTNLTENNPPKWTRAIAWFTNPKGLNNDKKLRQAVNGKVVLITGASFGIGEATAQRMAAMGAIVVLVARSADKLEQVAAAIRATGGKAFTYTTDLSKPDDAKKLAEDILRDHGHVDVLINNAGRSIRRSISLSVDRFHDFERTMAINYLGPVQLVLALLPSMQARKQGHIVNVASMAAYTPSKIVSAYATTKAAVRMLSDCLRAELADKNIHVSTICPGLSITNITQNTRFVGISDAEQADKRDKTTRLYQRRNLQPKEIANAILDAVKNRSAEVPVGLESHASRLLSRFFPSISRRIARLDVAP